MLKPLPPNKPLGWVTFCITTGINGPTACNFWPMAPDIIPDSDVMGSFGGTIPCAAFLAMFDLSSCSMYAVFLSMNEFIFCEIIGIFS